MKKSEILKAALSNSDLGGKSINKYVESIENENILNAEDIQEDPISALIYNAVSTAKEDVEDKITVAGDAIAKLQYACDQLQNAIKNISVNPETFWMEK